MSKQIIIKSRFATLAAAVAAAGIDLSYNPRIANEQIAELDCGFRGNKAIEAFVTSENEVFFLYQCDIRLLNKFTPFSACIDDSPFHVASIEGDTITISDARLPKNSESRKLIAEIQTRASGFFVTTL